MKAWVLHEVDNIKYEEVDLPTPEEGQVLVQVKAVGICGSDIPRIYKDGAHNMPLIPGHEFAGEVVEVGEKTDARWKYKRVGVYPLMPCHVCPACLSGRHEMCRNYDYLGSRRDGGFAEYVVVPEKNLIELPDQVSYEQAAMLEPLAVAVHAMRRIGLASHDTVVVCGLGTIGLLLAMALKQYGIKNLLAIGNKDFQNEKFLAMGFSEQNFCDVRKEEVHAWLNRNTNGWGADAIFECVGRNETIAQAINLVAPGGKICMVGNPYSDMTFDQKTYWKILRNQLEITGTWNSSFFTPDESNDWMYALSLLKEGRIKPQQLISHRFSLAQLDSGLHLMRDKTGDYLKVMISLG